MIEGTATEKSHGQLLLEETQRRALESAAVRLEREEGNSLYMAAWRKAAKIIRAMKP